MHGSEMLKYQRFFFFLYGSTVQMGIFLKKIYGLYFNMTKPYKYMNDEKSLLNQMIYNSDELIAQYKETFIEKQKSD